MTRIMTFFKSLSSVQNQFTFENKYLDICKSLSACVCFDFPEKLCMRTYCKQNKIKLKEKHVQRREKLVNTHKSFHQLFIWILSKICKAVAQHSNGKINGRLLL